jgi:hypothetical protein
MRHQPREEFAWLMSPGSAFRAKLAQLPSTGPVRTLLDVGGGQRLGREFIRQCGLAHGAEKDGNELGEPTPTNASQSLSCR